MLIERSQRVSLGKKAGLLYLAIILCGLFAGIVRSEIVDLNNLDNTLLNIINYEYLFRFGFLADVIMAICDALIAVFFYQLLKHVSPIWMASVTVLRFIQTAIIAVNVLNMFKPLAKLAGVELTIDSSWLVIADSIQLDMQMFEYGYLLSGMFFGLSCVIFGRVIKKSQVFPKFWGAAMSIAGSAYLLNCIFHFLNFDLASISQIAVVVIAVPVELGFCIYLLIKGVRN